MISSFLNTTDLLTTYGYIGIFLILFIESGIFFFLPGDSLLFAAGLFAALGKLSLAPLLILSFIGAFLGNIIGYWIGTHIEKLRKYSYFRVMLKDEHIRAAEDFFARRGKAAVLIARFVPAVRTFTPWAAGIAKMKRRVFIEWSALGAAFWILVMTLTGYYLGRAFPQIENYLTEVIILILIISILPALVGWLGRRSKRP